MPARFRTVVLFSAGLLFASCGASTGASSPNPTPDARPGDPSTTVIHPGAPGDTSRTIRSEEIPREARSLSEADVRFLQGMIAHHRQALTMAELARERAVRDDVRLLAQRIDRAQREEIERMERLLAAREEARPEAPMEVPTEVMAAGEESRHELMPGMLTDEQLEALAEASGQAFDRLFLESMILHHQGALVMVGMLFASEDGGQGAEFYQLAAHIESDQRIEIARMRAMLASGG